MNKFENTTFHASLIGNELNIFQFATIQMTIYDLGNFKLSYLNQLQWIMVTGMTLINYLII
jgi:hypothetical protein